MKKISMVIVSFILLISLISLTSAIWPFTGNAVNLPDSTTFCEDSDSENVEGIISGAIRYKYKTFGFTYTKSVPDKCENSKITEYYCEGNQAKSKKITCTFGCENEDITAFNKDFIAGHCKDEASEIPGTPGQTTTNACSDLDGADIRSPGFVNGTNYQGEFEGIDACDGQYAIREKVCGEDGLPKEVRFLCSRTENGKCKTQEVQIDGNVVQAAYCEPLSAQCSDSDNGLNITTSGVTSTVKANGQENSKKDGCIEDKKLKEYFCSGTEINSSIVNCEGNCKMGACVPKEAKCTDSDKGLDYNTKGRVSGLWIGEALNEEDYCRTAIQLGEYFCLNDTDKALYPGFTVGLKYTDCEFLCSNGACIQCTDTDGGKNFTGRGTVTTPYANATEFCADSETVLELGCSYKVENGWNFVGESKTSSRINSEYKKCPRGNICIEGACITPPEEN